MRKAEFGPAVRLGGVRGVAADWALWVATGAGARRIARFERILRLASLAFAVAQDAVEDARICNKGDDAHAGAAGAEQRVDLRRQLLESSCKTTGQMPFRVA